jgi:hypothetical protein
VTDLLPYALIGLAFAALLAWLHRATRPAHPAVSWAAEPTPRQWDEAALRRLMADLWADMAEDEEDDDGLDGLTDDELSGSARVLTDSLLEWLTGRSEGESRAPLGAYAIGYATDKRWLN